MRKLYLLVVLPIWGSLVACQSQSSSKTTRVDLSAHHFANDEAFLRQYHPDLVILRQGDAQALVCPAYQGRVMTSTADGTDSYGWINYDLIKSKKLQPHMNAFGGEDRFWMGPEGGQYAIFFKKGAQFNSDTWQTPAPIDSEPFPLVAKDSTSARFARNFRLTNYSGTTFDVGVERTVRLIPQADIIRTLDLPVDAQVHVVGVQSQNALINRGTQPWTPEKGLLSIWILGMMNASPEATVVIPFRSKGKQAGERPPLTDNYFGKVPADRLVFKDSVAYFRADAEYRSKIGVAPDRVKNWVGSYDPPSQTLTLITFSFNPLNNRYVNSLWEIQKEPYAGDVVNSYNDGPMKPGQSQMGKFFELETSSPAAALAPSDRLTHTHITYHIKGDKKQLDQVAQRLLGTTLAEIEGIF